MDCNICSISRVPYTNSASILLLQINQPWFLQTQTFSHDYLLPRFWSIDDSNGLLVFMWTFISFSFHFCSSLCHTISFQWGSYLLPQFPKVHCIDIKLYSCSYYVSYPNCTQHWIRGLNGPSQREATNRVVLCPCCICHVCFTALSLAVLFWEGCKDRSLFCSFEAEFLPYDHCFSWCRCGIAWKRRLEKYGNGDEGIWIR